MFSIANPNIIPEWFFKKANKLAINYHDGPLPKYAGTNSTSWAILNGEETHGVTWHIINSKVDAGDILKQEIFYLDKNETSLSLNLKCFKVAINLFSELIYDIENNNIKKTSQNKLERTFFYKNKKPSNAGILDWSETFEDIYKLVRSSYHGNYPNKFVTAKILIDKTFYVVNEIKVEEKKIKAIP